MIEVDFSISFSSCSVDVALMASSMVRVAQCILALEGDLWRRRPLSVKLQTVCTYMPRNPLLHSVTLTVTHTKLG